MVTVNSWIHTRQISVGPNSHQYLILLVPVWKIMSFETKWIAFFGAKSPYFLPRSRSPAKAMRYVDETTSFEDSAIRGTQ